MTGGGGADDAASLATTNISKPDGQGIGHRSQPHEPNWLVDLQPPIHVAQPMPPLMPSPRTHRTAATRDSAPRPARPAPATLSPQDFSSPQFVSTCQPLHRHELREQQHQQQAPAQLELLTPCLLSEQQAEEPRLSSYLLHLQPPQDAGRHVLTSDAMLTPAIMEKALQALSMEGPSALDIPSPFKLLQVQGTDEELDPGTAEPPPSQCKLKPNGILQKRASEVQLLPRPSTARVTITELPPAGSLSTPSVHEPLTRKRSSTRLSAGASILRSSSHHSRSTTGRHLIFSAETAAEDTGSGQPPQDQNGNVQPAAGDTAGQQGTDMSADTKPALTGRRSFLRAASSNLFSSLRQRLSATVPDGAPEPDTDQERPSSKPLSRRASMLARLSNSMRPQRVPSGELELDTRPSSKPLSRRASMLAQVAHSMIPQRTSASGALPNSSAHWRRASLANLFAPSGEFGLAQLLTASGGHTSQAPVRRSATSAVSISKSRRASVMSVLNSLVTGIRNEEVDESGGFFFTSLAQFRPIDFMYKHSRYMRMYFACSKRTGIYYILKKYDRDSMGISIERRIRTAIGLAGEASHPVLIPILGCWETDQAIYVVEEYASQGDMQQDSLAHPERYTERFMALQVIKPLLTVLAYLHSQKIVHRALFPENVLFGRDGKLRLGSYSSMANMEQDELVDKCSFLDYMAPEMLSIKDEDERQGSKHSGKSLARKARRKQAANAALSSLIGTSELHAGASDTSEGNGQPAGPLLNEMADRTERVSHQQHRQGRTAQAVAEGREGVSWNGGSARLTFSETPPTSPVQPWVSPSGHIPGLDEARSGAGGTLLADLANTFTRRGGMGFSEAVNQEACASGGLQPNDARNNSFASRQTGKSSHTDVIIPHNPWEWQESYDEKVDIWQVGCLVHELMCGCLPFEADDKLLAAALIMWADVVVFPDNVSPQCVSFMQACLTKDPRQRPSAEHLLTHEWITRQEAGEELLSQAALNAQEGGPQASRGLAAWAASGGLVGAAAKTCAALCRTLGLGFGAKQQHSATLPGNAQSRDHRLYARGSLQVAKGSKVTRPAEE